MTSSLRHRVLFGMLIGSCVAGDALAISSSEQKAAIIKLCSRAIDDYGAYIAGFSKGKKAAGLQREFAYCAAAIEDHDDFRR